MSALVILERRVLALPRAAWFLLGVSAAGAAVVVGGPWLLVGWLLPDLAVFCGGMRIADADGRMTPAAARGYNAAHVLAGPIILAGIGALIATPLASACAALWLSHIAIDRALGYWPRTFDDVSDRG